MREGFTSMKFRCFHQLSKIVQAKRTFTAAPDITPGEEAANLRETGIKGAIPANLSAAFLLFASSTSVPPPHPPCKCQPSHPLLSKARGRIRQELTAPLTSHNLQATEGKRSSAEGASDSGQLLDGTAAKPVVPTVMPRRFTAAYGALG